MDSVKLLVKSSKLLEYEFAHSYADYSLFTYRKGDIYMALLVYVDDIVLPSNNTSACRELKEYLNTCFSIKDLHPLKFFLGIEVACGPKGLFFIRRKYALEIVNECGLLGVKPSPSPMEESHKLALATGTSLDDGGRYQRLIGRLIYLTITRTYLCYAVHIVSQFMQAPREEHMAAACLVLQYIKGTRDCGILLKAQGDLNIIGYCDSDWGACPLTRRSLTGYLVTFGGSPI